MKALRLPLVVALAGALSISTAFAAPVITASKDDNTPPRTRKVVGNQITYTISLGNTGDQAATVVQFTDPDPANTTFVSLVTTPIARPDTYSAIGNVQITIPAGSGVLANDSDPDDAINGAGTLTVSAGATRQILLRISLAANAGRATRGNGSEADDTTVHSRAEQPRSCAQRHPQANRTRFQRRADREVPRTETGGASCGSYRNN